MKTSDFKGHKLRHLGVFGTPCGHRWTPCAHHLGTNPPPAACVVVVMLVVMVVVETMVAFDVEEELA